MEWLAGGAAGVDVVANDGNVNFPGATAETANLRNYMLVNGNVSDANDLKNRLFLFPLRTQLNPVVTTQARNLVVFRFINGGGAHNVSRCPLLFSIWFLFFSFCVQLNPVVTLQAGELVVFRFVNGGAHQYVELEMHEATTSITTTMSPPKTKCQMWLIALDGVYLRSGAPVAVDELVLAVSSLYNDMFKCVRVSVNV
jgi:FtsP/CotA-like multicopper oxidase with cupredoxin domain